MRTTIILPFLIALIAICWSHPLENTNYLEVSESEGSGETGPRRIRNYGFGGFGGPFGGFGGGYGGFGGGYGGFGGGYGGFGGYRGFGGYGGFGHRGFGHGFGGHGFYG